MSTSTEEYLEALHTLTQDGKTASTTAISKRLTTGFEIHDHNLVFYGKYKKYKRSV